MFAFIITGTGFHFRELQTDMFVCPEIIIANQI